MREPHWAPGNLLDRVAGPPDSLSLSQRVLNATTFCTTAACLLNFAADLLIGHPWAVAGISGSASLVFGLLHQVGRRGWREEALGPLFLVRGLGFLVMVWRVAGDLSGSPVVVAMALAGLVPMLTEGRPRLILLTSLVILLVGMYIVQGMQPAWLAGLPPDVALRDTFATAVLLGAGLASLVSLVVLSHRREQERVREAGRRLERLNQELRDRNHELDRALQEIRTLEGIIPICASCKKIRNDKGYFEAVEAYITRHSGARFSHTFCPDCARRQYGELLDPENPSL